MSLNFINKIKLAPGYESVFFFFLNSFSGASIFDVFLKVFQFSMINSNALGWELDIKCQ